MLSHAAGFRSMHVLRTRRISSPMRTRPAPVRSIAVRLLVNEAYKEGKTYAKRRGGMHDSTDGQAYERELLTVQGRKIMRAGEQLGRKKPRTRAQWDVMDPMPGMASMAPMTLRLWKGEKWSVR